MFDRKPDLTMREVTAPINMWCSSGHVASETFRRGGPETEALPTRFFEVSSSKDSTANGTYCEPCLMVANYISWLKKNGDMHG